MKKNRGCPVCGKPVESHPYWTCTNCQWEGDDHQEEEANYPDGPNHISLNERRIVYFAEQQEEIRDLVKKLRAQYRRKRGSIYRKYDIHNYVSKKGRIASAAQNAELVIAREELVEKVVDLYQKLLNEKLNI